MVLAVTYPWASASSYLSSQSSLVTRQARAWFHSPSSASQTNSSATVYVAGVLLGLGSLGVGGNRRLAVALVSFRCLTCLFDGLFDHTLSLNY